MPTAHNLLHPPLDPRHPITSLLTLTAQGGNAYYHAHKPRNTGEAPAPPPVHVVLERCQNEVTETVETIFNYQVRVVCCDRAGERVGLGMHSPQLQGVQIVEHQ